MVQKVLDLLNLNCDSLASNDFPMNGGKSKGGHLMIVLSFCTTMVNLSASGPFCAQAFPLCSGQAGQQEQKCS